MEFVRGSELEMAFALRGARLRLLAWVVWDLNDALVIGNISID